MPESLAEFMDPNYILPVNDAPASGNFFRRTALPPLQRISSEIAPGPAQSDFLDATVSLADFIATNDYILPSLVGG